MTAKVPSDNTRVRDQIRRWANDLIDLSRRNSSLFFRHLKRSTVEIVAPSATEILAQLPPLNGAQKMAPFYLPPVLEEEQEWSLGDCLDAADSTELVARRIDRKDLVSSLKALVRQTDLDLIDRGIHSLYLCIGMLHWKETPEADEVHSPLLFIPVKLTHDPATDRWGLQRVEADATFNSSLQVLLDQQFDIEVAAQDWTDPDESGIEELLGFIRRFARPHGWTVDATVVLKRATFHKEAMFRDLIENIDVIAEDEVVTLLADPQAESVDEEINPIPPEDEMDQVAPPEEAHLILDADASQRRAIHAALGEHSFVMDGPPGTGKSQTIANMIAELMSSGKSVLFVSEKAAALDVVHSRLKDRGLHPFLFQLHSHKASRKEVAAELGRTLRERPVARAMMSSTEREEARRLRERLSKYPEALNQTRDPLGRTLYWALGRLALLSTRYSAPLPSEINRDLSPDRWNELNETFEILQRSWAPMDDEEFTWGGLLTGPYSDALRIEIEQQIDRLITRFDRLEELTDATSLNTGLEPTGTLEGIAHQIAVLEHVRTQPFTEKNWWVTPRLRELQIRAQKLADMTSSQRSDIALLQSTYGDNWGALPIDGSQRLKRYLKSAQHLSPSLVPEESLEPAGLAAQRQFLDQIREAIAGVKGDLRMMEESLGVPKRERLLTELLDIAAIAARTNSAVRPDARWASPSLIESVGQAIETIKPLLDDYQKRHAQLSAVFEDEVYELDLDSLINRFQTQHTGLRKLGSAYRSDKKLVASVSKSRKGNAEVRAHLNEALALKQLRTRLDNQEKVSGSLLGSFYAPRASRVDLAVEALNLLRFALEKLGPEYNSEAIAQQFAGDAPAEPTLAGRGSAVLSRLREWIELSSALFGSAIAESLTGLTLAQVDEWMKKAGEALDVVHELSEEARSLRTGPPTLKDLSTELEARSAIEQRGKEFSESFDQDRLAVGELYLGVDTDWEKIVRGIQWTAELQKANQGPLPTRAADALFGAGSHEIDELEETLAQVRKEIESFVNLFEQERGASLREELTSSIDQSRQLLAEMQARGDEIQVWLTFCEIARTLRETGWSATLEAIEERGVRAAELIETLEKALLAAWVDSIIQGDSSLKGIRAQDLNERVEKFRKLDQQLIKDAAERVVMYCCDLRPQTDIGQAGIMQRESLKKSRHMPVRTLLQQTGDVAKRLKPCFMMSPLAVSQYLPPSFRFDVIIFDEASQIRPADAINCIYRGERIVVAGDDRQLPPTSFFEVGSLEDDGEYEEGQFEEFESILGQCKGTVGLPSLPLRWHYRSQHEALITFSNYRFYDGELVTFPGAQQAAPDLGIELFIVPGLYRRGGPRDNVVEAEKVVERVVHHLENHPHLSIGVVSFSQAQADTILDRIDRLREERPDLENHFSGDRLDGFFVKALENVQGDERDIMIFSPGYGPDENGRFTLNFGPLNRDGGWRRLNVAITRARRRVEVVSSFQASQMDVRGSTNRGVLELHRYLEYAERGFPALGIEIAEGVGDIESPLEQSVFDTIRSLGYEPVPQVGSAGYRVDIGVRDPTRHGRYLLGVECDGAAYHSSKVARDRDRLRQSVLENLGWTLHRVWGPAWYRDRKGQESFLKQALENASRRSLSRKQPDPAAIERQVEQEQLSEVPEWAVHYPVSSLPSVNKWVVPYDAAVAGSLVKLIGEVIRTESPVHVDVIGERVREAWGRNVTSKVRAAIDLQVRGLERQGVCTREGDFVWKSENFRIRVPTSDERTRREIAHIPQEEIQDAVYRLLQDAHSAGEAELQTRLTNLFGFSRRGARIQAALMTAISELENQGWIERGGDGLLRPIEEDGDD